MREEFIAKIQYLIGEYGFKFLCSTDQRYSSAYFQKVLELKILLNYVLNTDEEMLYTRTSIFPFITRPYKESNNEYYATLAEESATQAEVYYAAVIEATAKGFLVPRMLGSEAEAIELPEEGLLIYATNGNGVIITSKGWWGFNGVTWEKLN